MKKLIFAMAAIVVLGTLSYRIADADQYSRGGYGYGCNGPGYAWSAPGKVNFEAREKFYEESKEIRQQLFEKRGEYADVLNTDPVDKAKARELWGEIYGLQTEIEKMAADKNVFLGGPDYCLGPNGYYEGAAEEANFPGNRGHRSDQRGMWPAS